MMEKVRELLAGRGRRAAAGRAVPAPPPRRRLARAAVAARPAAIDDDEYGEISIDTGRESVADDRRACAPRRRRPRRPRSPGAHQQPIHAGRADAPAPPRRRRSAAGGSSPGMRPSLIPGHAAGRHAARAPGDGARASDPARRCPRPRRRVRRLSRSGGR